MENETIIVIPNKPCEIEKVLGLTVNKNLEIDHILNWEDINK